MQTHVRTLALVLALGLAQSVAAQAPARRFEVLAGNYHTSYPVLGFPALFYQTYHPGFQAGYEWRLKESGRRTWALRARAGFFYHRFIQTAIPLAAEGVFHWRPGKAPSSRWGLEAGLGAGYLHSFPLTDVFRLQSDGSYKREFQYGRPQATISLTPGISYALDGDHRTRLLLRYQMAFQLPFVSGFVPLLPYNILQVGASFGLTPTTHKAKLD